MKRFILMVGFILISSYSLAMDIPARPQNAIYDPQTIIPETALSSLSNSLVSFWNLTHVNPWVALVPGLTSEDVNSLAPKILEDWSLREVTQPPSQGDVLFLITEHAGVYRTKLVVTPNLENKFSPGELELISRQEVMTVNDVGDSRRYPDIQSALIAIQNVFLSGIHIEDTSPKGNFQRAYEQWLVAPWYQKIFGAFMLLFFVIFVPIAFVLGKIRSTAGDSGGSGDSMSGGGGDFGGGGGSGKW